MPKWIHDRAEHLLAKNPSMPKSQAFAIATQQAHAVGKSPKGYGTSEGRHEAKAKYDTPKDDKKTANPGHLESPKMDKQAQAVMFAAFRDELTKIASGDFLQALLKLAFEFNFGGVFGQAAQKAEQGLAHAAAKVHPTGPSPSLVPMLKGKAPIPKAPRVSSSLHGMVADEQIAEQAAHRASSGAASHAAPVPSMRPSSMPGFSMPPLQSSAGATRMPSMGPATVPAPRAA